MCFQQEPETEAAAEPDEVLPTVEVLPEATSLPSIAEVVLEQQSSVSIKSERSKAFVHHFVKYKTVSCPNYMKHTK